MIGKGPYRRGPEEGATAVEAAIIISVLITLILGAIEFGQAFWTYNTMLLAVEEASRYAMVYNAGAPSTCTGSPPASCPANLANCVVDQANQVLSSYASTGVTVSVTSCTAATTSPPAPATMTILGTYTVVPTLLPAFGTISNTAVPYQVTVPLI